MKREEQYIARADEARSETGVQKALDRNIDEEAAELSSGVQEVFQLPPWKTQKLRDLQPPFERLTLQIEGDHEGEDDETKVEGF